MAIKNPNIQETFIVPWRKVNGKPVHTCGIIEEELGLYSEKDPLIFGWCPRGFYTRRPEELSKHLKTIDWKRMAFIHDNFDVKADRVGYVMINDHESGYVTETRYRRLIRQCFKSVPKEVFDREVAKANKLCQRGWGTGSLGAR